MLQYKCKDIGVNMEDEKLMKIFNPILKRTETILFFLIMVINGLIWVVSDIGLDMCVRGRWRVEVGLSIQSEDPTHPKVPTGSDPKTGRPDQVTGRRRVICSKNRLRRVGLGFPLQNPKKPDPIDVLRISNKNFQNPVEISKIRRDFPDSGFKFLDSDFKFSDSSNKFSYSGYFSSRSSDISSKSSEISPDPARSHQIRLDLRRIWRFFT